MANTITRVSNSAGQLVVYASAARTAEPDTQEYEAAGYRGMHLVIDVTAASDTPSIVVQILGVDRVSAKTYTVLVSAAITGTGTTVLRVGGRDINGTVRDLFPAADYTALDIAPGGGVDIVADAATWVPDRTYDLVVCCEVFEHTDVWPDICGTAYAALRPGGPVLADGDREAAIVQECQFMDRYVDTATVMGYDVPVLLPDFRDGSAVRVEERHDRSNLVLESPHLRKWKGTWR